MPSRTLDPLTSTTSTTTSSPSMIFSPARRVMISTLPSLETVKRRVLRAPVYAGKRDGRR
jgi:hypothetical protein